MKECETAYGLKISYNNKISLHTLKRLRKKLYKIKNEEQIKFVYGVWKRKSALQKSVETLEPYIDKLKEYTKKLHICGERNSYSITDPDATFMKMKEDAMMNGQLKPAYNLRHGVDSEYITWLTISERPADTRTLIPFLKEMEEYLTFKYKEIIADAGYESEKNYLFLEDNDPLAFIQPQNYEISKTRKYQQAISRMENMDYDADNDTYCCRNGQMLTAQSIILAIGYNINKLHRKIQSERTGQHLFSLKKTA